IFPIVMIRNNFESFFQINDAGCAFDDGLADFTMKTVFCSKLCSPPEFSSVIVMERSSSNNRAAPKRQIAFRKPLLRLAFGFLLATALTIEVKAAAQK